MIDRNTNVQITDEALAFAKPMLAEVAVYNEDAFMLFDNVSKKHFSFLPDFKVFYKDRHEYHEVKGWMDERSKTKIRLMAECHPNETLVVIDSKWFSEHTKGVNLLISDWEDMSKRNENRTGI